MICRGADQNESSLWDRLGLWIRTQSDTVSLVHLTLLKCCFKRCCCSASPALLLLLEYFAEGAKDDAKEVRVHVPA